MEKDESFGIVPVLVSEGETARFLLIHQTTGHWAFPKGHPEAGEGPLETARRELQEETGIAEVSIDKDFSHVQHYAFEKDGKTVEKQVTFFMGLISDDTVEIKTDEIQDYGWFKYEDALERITYDDSKKLLSEVVDNLTSLNYRI